MVFNRILKSRQSGFTLFELLVAMAIISILTAIAVPSIINRVPDYRLKSAVRDMVSCLQEVKLRAIKDNSDVVIILDPANDKYTAFVDMVKAPAGNPPLFDFDNVAPDDFKVMEKNMPAGIDFYKTSFEPNGANTLYYVCFDSKGMPKKPISGGFGNGSIYMKNNSPLHIKIIVNVVGNIRIEKSMDGVNWN